MASPAGRTASPTPSPASPDDYDFCIVDCPPNVGLLTFNAMRASSDVSSPWRPATSPCTA